MRNIHLIRAYISQYILVALLAVGLMGCSSLNPFSGDDPTMYDLRIKASGDLNPDYNGRASPVKLRIYQLKSLEVFDNADFFALESKDKDTLGGDIVDRLEMTITPNSKEFLPEVILQPEACCIGVFAVYRDLEEATWRQSVTLEPEEHSGLEITLGRLAIATNVGEPD